MFRCFLLLITQAGKWERKKLGKDWNFPPLLSQFWDCQSFLWSSSLSGYRAPVPFLPYPIVMPITLHYTYSTLHLVLYAMTCREDIASFEHSKVRKRHKRLQRYLIQNVWKELKEKRAKSKERECGKDVWNEVSSITQTSSPRCTSLDYVTTDKQVLVWARKKWIFLDCCRWRMEVI